MQPMSLLRLCHVTPSESFKCNSTEQLPNTYASLTPTDYILARPWGICRFVFKYPNARGSAGGEGKGEGGIGTAGIKVRIIDLKKWEQME